MLSRWRPREYTSVGTPLYYPKPDVDVQWQTYDIRTWDPAQAIADQLAARLAGPSIWVEVGNGGYVGIGKELSWMDYEVDSLDRALRGLSELRHWQYQWTGRYTRPYAYDPTLSLFTRRLIAAEGDNRLRYLLG